MARIRTALAAAAFLAALGGTQALAEVTVLGWPGGPEETALRAVADTYNQTAADADKVFPIFGEMFGDIRPAATLLHLAELFRLADAADVGLQRRALRIRLAQVHAGCLAGDHPAARAGNRRAAGRSAGHFGWGGVVAGHGGTSKLSA